MSNTKGVIIGVDPHKTSATIEVVDTHEQLLGTGRFATDETGYAAMRAYVKQWPNRTWAVEGANGAGRPLAQRLVENGEHVLDVSAKLAARVRLFDTGHNRKTDALDTHSIGVVAVRTPGLRILAADGELEALRMRTDRRDELAHQRVNSASGRRSGPIHPRERALGLPVGVTAGELVRVAVAELAPVPLGSELGDSVLDGVQCVLTHAGQDPLDLRARRLPLHDEGLLSRLRHALTPRGGLCRPRRKSQGAEKKHGEEGDGSE